MSTYQRLIRIYIYVYSTMSTYQRLIRIYMSIQHNEYISEVNQNTCTASKKLQSFNLYCASLLFLSLKILHSIIVSHWYNLVIEGNGRKTKAVDRIYWHYDMLGFEFRPHHVSKLSRTCSKTWTFWFYMIIPTVSTRLYQGLRLLLMHC